MKRWQAPGEACTARPRWYDWRWVAVVLVLIAAGLALTGVYRGRHGRHQLTNKDMIVLPDFENHTGDPDFDGRRRAEPQTFLRVRSDADRCPLIGTIAQGRQMT